MPGEAGQLTLMAVHAHPDDEAISTGGILARYSDEGVRTVLVTCTNGELGDGPGGVKPGEAGHDESLVVATRAKELESSCRILGVSELEMLGFRDSGMMGWDQNDDERSFWRTPVREGARRLSEAIRRYQPQVVVTYDSNGFYGHPDHIQAHRITVEALDETAIPAKLYNPAIPRSTVPRFQQMLREAGVEGPEEIEQGHIGTPDDQIAAFIDCTSVAGRKFDALSAHASQAENTFFLRLGRERFTQAFANEAFVRLRDRTGAELPESDLFSGLRPSA